MVWLVLAVAALVLTAGAAAASLRLRTASAFGLAVYLLAAAEIVLLTELLSFVSLVGAGGYAVGEALLLTGALVVWHLRGRPRPPLRRLDLRVDARAHPVLAALALLVLGAVVYQAFLVFATPPNNWDSMTYHLPRAAAWLQKGAVEYIDGAPTERQNAFQPNGEIEILYTFAFVGRDTAAAATQLVAELALLLAVYGCARRLGYGRAPSTFAALLTATLSEVALQSVTTQNDLVAASFVASAACLVLGADRRELPLAGLAVGLALGTKLTAGAALPLIALLAISRVPRARRLAAVTVASAAAFVLVGAYGYILNIAETGRVLGDPSAQGHADPRRVTLPGTVSTSARIVFRFIDLSGFHTKGAFSEWARARGKNVFDGLGIDPNPHEATATRFGFEINERPHEDVSFFGPLGFLLLPFLGVGFLVAAALRRARPATAVLALSVPLFVIAIALTFRYNPWIGRFFIAPVALTMPLVATLYRFRLAAGLIALVGALTLGLAHAYNEGKPTGLEPHTFGETRAVWELPRARAQAIFRPELIQVIDGLEQYVPHGKRGRLGFVLDGDDWSYLLYGPTLDRRLIPLPRDPLRLLDAAARANADWVILDREAPRPPPRENWTPVEFVDSRWTLFLYPEEL
jgi:hypothetical protein